VSDTTLLGGGTLLLRVTPQMPQAQIVARVVDEPPVGSSSFPAGYGTLLASGWLEASHRGGDAPGQVRPLDVGRPVMLSISIWPTAYRVPKGDTMCLELYSSDVPRFVPPAQPSLLTIDLARSELSLPVLGPRPRGLSTLSATTAVDLFRSGNLSRLSRIRSSPKTNSLP
jgi:predicted acyl esterase